MKQPIWFPPNMRQRLLELAYDTVFLGRRTLRRISLAWYRLTRHRLVVEENTDAAERVFEILTEDCITLDHVTYVGRKVRLTTDVVTWCRENAVIPFLMGSDSAKMGGSGQILLFFRTRDEAFAFKMRWL